LTVRRGGGEPEIHRGHGGLAAVLEMLASFEATLHEVSGLVVRPDGDGEARGECVCVAHHVTRGQGRDATDLVLRGRYADRYVRDADGAWRFAARELRVLWTEKVAVRLA
jgi:hypothetical protein